MMFVDDNPSARVGVVKNLRSWFPQYDIDEAGSVAEAKKVLRQCAKEGHIARVIIVDEKLHETNRRAPRGSDLLSYAQKHYPGMCKIMLASQATPADLSKAINRGGLDRYVQKRDYDRRPSVLRDVIRDALEEEHGFLYDALFELVERAEKVGEADQVVLVAGDKSYTVREIFQHIAAGTEVGQEHMKRFAQLIFLAVKEPEEFLGELSVLSEGRKALASKSRGRKSKQQRQKKDK